MLPVYGDAPEPTEDDPAPERPVIGERPNPGIPAGVVEISDTQWLELLTHPDECRWNGLDVVVYTTPAPPLIVPDSPTLSDWRVGLTLWKRDDGTLRIDEVTDKVAALVKAGNPMGRIARERLEYANTVICAQLMQLAGVLGFSEAEIEEASGARTACGRATFPGNDRFRPAKESPHDRPLRQ